MTETSWYYTTDDKVLGPFSAESLHQMVAAGLLTESSLVARDGETNWRNYKEVVDAGELSGIKVKAQDPSGFFSGIAGKVSQASGLEKLEGFSITHLFSQAFRKHTPGEIEEHFSAGTVTTTPSLENVITKWPTPWAFVRLLGMSLLVSIGFYWAIGRFENLLLIPGWMFVGCFGIPFAVLVFFVETNILKNVSFYRVLTLLFSGGLLSLIVSLFLFELTDLGSWLGVMAAGIVEELGKLLAVVFFTRKWTGFKWILNGMLFGAAVGTGFSAFESAGYVFLSFGSADSFGAETTMTLRAFLSPFTHTIWTAATAAALWRVKGDRAFQFGMLMDLRFIRIFGLIAALHMLWNSPLNVPFIGGMTGYLALRIAFGLFGWIIILLLIQSGIKEVRVAQSDMGDS